MGEVYLAHDTQLQRPVALKVLPAEMRGDEELRNRLEHEARAASALNHPNILTVYDVGRLGDDHFIAAEYVDGITLRQRMQRGEVPLAEVMSIATQIASALEIGRASCRERVESAGGGVGVGTDNEGGGWTGQGWGTS